MGPGDPFSASAPAPEMQVNDMPNTSREQRQDGPPDQGARQLSYETQQAQSERKNPMTSLQSPFSKSKFVLGGLISGVLFGICVLVAGWSSTLLVVICGGVGAVLAWVAYGLASGQLDFSAAWRALRGK